MRFRKTDTFYLLYCFFEDFAFIYPVYMVLFRNHGLSFIDISLLMVVWTASALVLEIPSGVLADLWSRKLSVSFSLLFKSAAFLAWLFLPDFTGFALGFLLWGAMEAFTSGTLEALLYDALKHEGREDEYVKITGLGMTASRISIALAMVSGGFLFSGSPALVLILSSLSMIVSALCILPLPEPSRNPETGKDKTSLSGSVKELAGMCREIFSSAGMVPLILFGCLVDASYGVAEEFDTLFGEWNGVPIAYVGLWGGLRFLVEGAGGLLAAGLERRFGFGKPGRLALWTGVSGVSLLLGTVHAALLPFYFLFYFMVSIGLTHYQGTLQRRFESAGRATLSSVAGFLFTASGMATGLLFGAVADRFGLRALFRTAALLVAAAAFLYAAGTRGKRSSGKGGGRRGKPAAERQVDR